MNTMLKKLVELTGKSSKNYELFSLFEITEKVS